MVNSNKAEIKMESIDATYWETQYQNKNTGWDLGIISPAVAYYIDSLKDKNRAILIPGCGNSYEAEYLLAHGFTNITVLDISPTLVSNLRTKFRDNASITILLGDFFEHNGEYDYIIEQTFFCALPPALRQKYVQKMNELLSINGVLFGLLFNRQFDTGPPYGGSQKEYETIFQSKFAILKMELSLQSAASRANSEIFIAVRKLALIE